MLRAVTRHVWAPRANAVTRLISTAAPQWAKAMPRRPAPLPEEEFTEAFLCGSGPGGQKINKTSSAVQLKHIPTGIVLKVQATRSRSQNRKIAREMLAERVELLEKGADSRVAIVGNVKAKRKSSASKKSKRKYKALDDAKAESLEASKATETGDSAGKDSQGAS
ncbi:hypothetical protein V493_02087 [Pseudogymnoascus sp. VKM F-4281 (FW-2241)]|nr:hypothetical protein V493_02087 [Pseudogymnoascus sp. VKM F-4281 (FW-2241)]